MMSTINYLQKPIEWSIQRTSSFDVESFCQQLSKISGKSVAEVQEKYQESVHGDLRKIYLKQYRSKPTGIAPQYISLRWRGFSMYTGLDRIALYILTRLEKPSVVYETGVLWGDSAFFILKAMERNNKGELHSFDVGWREAKRSYGAPPGVDELGWVIPQCLRERWNCHVGNSLEKIPEIVRDTPSVDLFYHDSLHTYDHMLSEFRTIYPQMSSNGLLMSEDTHQNDAWEDFLAKNQTEGDFRFNSHMGFQPKREVAATRTP